MKKRMIAGLAVAAMAVILFTGCGKGEFSLAINDDMKSATVTATNAKNDMATAGSLIVEDGEHIRVTGQLEKGSEVKVTIMTGSDAGIDASVAEIAEGEEVATATVSDTESEAEINDIKPGSYMVKAESVGKANGTAEITVE